jgi:hypothetical protein
MSKNLCLQHFRALEEASKQKQLKDFLPEIHPTPIQIEEFSDPIYHAELIHPTAEQVEVLASGTCEETTEALLDMLVQFKKQMNSRNKVH